MFKPFCTLGQAEMEELPWYNYCLWIWNNLWGISCDHIICRPYLGSIYALQEVFAMVSKMFSVCALEAQTVWRHTFSKYDHEIKSILLNSQSLLSIHSCFKTLPVESFINKQINKTLAFPPFVWPCLESYLLNLFSVAFPRKQGIGIDYLQLSYSWVLFVGWDSSKMVEKVEFILVVFFPTPFTPPLNGILLPSSQFRHAVPSNDIKPNF